MGFRTMQNNEIVNVTSLFIHPSFLFIFILKNSMTLKNSRKNTLFYSIKTLLPTYTPFIFFLTALPTPQNKNHPVHKTYRRKKNNNNNHTTPNSILKMFLM